MTSYTYDTENRLVGVSGGNAAGLRYDPLGRLYEITDGVGNKTRLLYSGDELIAEYNASGAMLSRYVHGLGGGDDPLIRYPGADAANTVAEHLYADRLGSIVASFTRAGAVKAINAYDEYGVPGAPSGVANTGRFRYTGQMWIPELGQYHYKARAYSPTLGRFMQTDPIGYADGLNMYAYVGNDPTNFVDPLGLRAGCHTPTGTRIQDCSQREAAEAALVAGGISAPTNDQINAVLGFWSGGGGSLAALGQSLGVKIEGVSDGEDRIVVWGSSAQGDFLLAGRWNGPEPDWDNKERWRESDADDAEERDRDICRSLRNEATRARCWAQAKERDAARRAGRPIPPLVNQRESAPAPPRAPSIPIHKSLCRIAPHPIIRGACLIFF